jgi:RNA polymerase sigma factor (sigma-70 family)
VASQPLRSALYQLRRAALLQEHTGLSDAQLLEHFLNRREDIAFELLLRRHGPMVYGVCRRVLGNDADAEDAFQATFLVLFRRAATVVPRCLVGNWLYGVAFHTAIKSRAALAKRRTKEREAATMARPHVPDEARRHLQMELDAALHGLPEKYRVAVVLCDLEGKTRKEAAEQLGWAEGTVASRLARARGLLARRLARCGLPFSTSLLAIALAENAVAVLPPMLIEKTMQAATSGAVPPSVAVLIQGVVHAMVWKKARITLFVMLAVGAIASGVGAFFAPGNAREASPAGGGAAATVVTQPPLDRKRLLDEFARADAVFVGKVVHADLDETFWSGWMMSTKEVVYDVSSFLKGEGRAPVRRPAQFLILGGPSDAYYRDGDRPRLNPRLFAENSEHLVCLSGAGRNALVTFVTPLVKEARTVIQNEAQQGKAIPFREIFRAFDGGPREATESVIRSREDWHKFIQSCKERAVRQRLEQTTVNFDEVMVVVIGIGPFRDKLVPLEEKQCGVTKVLETDDALWVKYSVIRSDEVVDQPACPVFVVKLRRNNKRVLFEKRETPGG